MTESPGSFVHRQDLVNTTFVPGFGEQMRISSVDESARVASNLTGLSEFRSRLIDHGLDELVLDVLLPRLGELGSVKAGGKQRTDSTHVIAANRIVPGPQIFDLGPVVGDEQPRRIGAAAPGGRLISWPGSCRSAIAARYLPLGTCRRPHTNGRGGPAGV